MIITQEQFRADCREARERLGVKRLSSHDEPDTWSLKRICQETEEELKRLWAEKYGSIPVAISE